MLIGARDDPPMLCPFHVPERRQVAIVFNADQRALRKCKNQLENEMRERGFD